MEESILFPNLLMGYNYYGLHKVNGKWVFREWAPNATNIYLIGDFNNWERSEDYQCRRIEDTAGDWELVLDERENTITATCLRCMSCGMGEKANVFPHGHNELFKMKEQKYSLLKYGVLKKNTNGT